MRTVASLGFALALVCAAPTGRLHAQAVAAPAQAGTPAPDPLAELPADLKAKVDGIMEKAAQVKRSNFDQRMRHVTADLMKTTGLAGDAPRQALGAAAREAADHSVQECIELARKRIGRNYRQNPQQSELAINNTVGTGGLAAMRSEGETLPEKQEAWTAAVQRVLTPAQSAAWQAKLAEDRGREDAKLAKFLDEQMEHAREQVSLAMRAQVADMTASLSLPPGRAEQLDVLGRDAVEAALQVSRLATERVVRGLPEDEQQRLVAANRLYYALPGDSTPTNQAVWKAGLERLLTDAERQRLGALQDERETRRARALGRMLLVVLDAKTALTGTQRDRLLGPAEEAVKQVKALFPPGDSQNYYQFSRENFFEAATHVPGETVQAVLDPVQWQRWRQACQDSAEGKDVVQPRRGRRRAAAVEGSTEKNEPPIAPNAEPEEVERLLSDLLEEKTAEERRHELAVILLKTEDVARVAGLEEPATARLKTAARGTVEEALAPWKANLAQNARAQMENGDPENLRAVLTNLSNMQFGANDPGQPAEKSFWDETVDRELTVPQRAAWQRAVDARDTYQEQAIAALILAEFDRRYQITAEQWERFQPLLLTVLRDYGPEIHRTFAYSSANTPWYFQSYTMFLPLMGVPEDEMKATVGEDRWARWSSSAEHGNTIVYWQNIQQAHNQK